MSQSIEQLVNQAVNGSQSALEEVVRRIQGRVHGLCLRMLFHPMEAEDACQEILIKVITNLKGFRFEGSFEGWVFRIAANHLKSARPSTLELLGFDNQTAQAHIDRAQAKGWFSNPQAAPEAVLEVEMRSACTQALLMALDRPLRIVFILAVVMDMPGPEGARILEITPAAFRKRLSRARGQLVDYMRLNCGLFDEGNPCTCAALAQGRMSQGWLNPGKTVFVDPARGAGDPVILKDCMKELDDLSKIAALFKALPQRGDTPEPAVRIKEILEGDGYLLLSDRHLH